MVVKNNSAAIFFKLTDQNDEKADSTVAEIARLSHKFGINDILNLNSYILTGNRDEVVLIYSLDLNTSEKKETSGNAIDFLEYVFKHMFDKYPTYTEPVGV